MRIFYALTFDNNTKKSLSKYAEIVKNNTVSGNYSSYDNYHLTLEYIGEIQENELNYYIGILTQLDIFPHEIVVNHINTFNKKNKHIVWLGIEDNILVNTLQEHLMNLLRLDITQKFIPHITISREAKLLESFNEIEIDDEIIDIYSIALMESTRIDERIVYLPIKEIIMKDRE